MRHARLTDRDKVLLDLIAVCRITTSQHIVEALISRESPFALMESTQGVMPLTLPVLEKRLTVLEKSGYVRRWTPSSFHGSKHCWLSTGKGVAVTRFAGVVPAMNSRASVLDGSLSHALLLTTEIGRLKAGYLAIPDVVLKAALSRAKEIDRSFTPSWDPATMQPLWDGDTEHLAPGDRFTSAPIEPDITVVNEATNEISYYVEIETSGKPVSTYIQKMKAFGASARPVLFVVGTTAQGGSRRDIQLIERRLEEARSSLGLTEQQVVIQRADMALATPDPAGYRAAQLAA